MIDAQTLARAATIPLPRAEQWIGPINAAMLAFEINTAARQAAFIAQTAHETRGYSRWVEDLNYSTPERIIAVFPSRFRPSAEVQEELRFAAGSEDEFKASLRTLMLEAARPYVRSPISLANRVYANRLGNGDVESGDGWRYIGRGLIQITGRDNYAEAERGLGLSLLENPELLLHPDHAASSAAWWWYLRGLNRLADKGELDGITRIINGHAMLGREERLLAFHNALGNLA